MIDQLKIGNKYSYDDFDASMKERKINAPKKKSIKDTVPFSNETHDFSKINGEVYWEERPLEYVFEILANSPEELQEKKQPFLDWIMNIMNENIYDPYIEDYHFVGTYEDCEPDDSEIEKTTITVKFSAYPYMISNMKKSYSFDLVANKSVEVLVVNNSSHRITPTFVNDVPVVIQYGNSSYSIAAGETTDDSFNLEAGANTLTLQATANGIVTIEFWEEVF